MPSPAETAAALQGLDPVIQPKQMVDPYSAAMTFGSAVGIPDAIKALKGQMTPEEAKEFALTSAIGLLPGAKGEAVVSKAARTIAENLIDLPGSQAAKKLAANHPDMQKLILQHMDDLTNAAPGNTETYLKNASALKSFFGSSLSDENIDKVLASSASKMQQGYKAPIEQEDIDKMLAKNPGASIFDVAKTNVGGPSSKYTIQNPWENLAGAVDYPTIPREATPYTPLAASVLGTSENLVHGTRIGGPKWQGGEDKLMLPADEIGVHFGNPKQASVFTGSVVNNNEYPRTYPVVVATNNPLRMPDLGSWHLDKMTDALEDYYPEDVDKLYGMKDIKDVRDYLTDKGYDSIVYKNSEEDQGHDSYIKFAGAPSDPNFVTGVRSPWAKFDPTQLSNPSILAGLAGGAAVAPAIDPDLIKALQGDPNAQSQ